MIFRQTDALLAVTRVLGGRRREVGGGQADMRALVLKTPVNSLGLLQLVEHVDIHRGYQPREDVMNLAAVEFVGPVHCFRIPVGPVDGVLEDSQGKGVVEVLVGGKVDQAVLPVQVRAGDKVQLRVHPIEAVVHIIDGQTIRPFDVGGDDG